MDQRHGHVATDRQRARRNRAHSVWKPVKFMYATAAIALLGGIGVSLLSKEADMLGQTRTLVTALHVGAIGCWVIAGVAWGLASSIALVHILVRWLIPPRGAL